MEISEKARPDRWNKVFEDVSCAPVRERWKPGIKKKRGSCRACFFLGGGGLYGTQGYETRSIYVSEF